ncbi:hypothetical protein QSE00_23785 [Arenibacter sp. M-2]|uniref:hypothetical protein n=1 Tax=Arenibacter sp. M-2 TaxID=3053612 RepID=UPI00257039E7|nr:hypothetical protein [Arenibacter sp. M-2]MDL5514852.1 hypothetical protein [Arenibacter sp. M-2]
MIHNLKNITATLFTIYIIIGCEDIVEVTDISDVKVELLAPLQNSVVGDSIVNFSWYKITEADSYVVQVATPNFESAVQLVMDSIIVVDSTFIGAKATKILIDNNYEWRVKAMNSGYETPFSSSAFRVNATGN